MGEGKPKPFNNIKQVLLNRSLNKFLNKHY